MENKYQPDNICEKCNNKRGSFEYDRWYTNDKLITYFPNESTKLRIVCLGCFGKLQIDEKNQWRKLVKQDVK
jgi:hypothetical protein